MKKLHIMTQTTPSADNHDLDNWALHCASVEYERLARQSPGTVAAMHHQDVSHWLGELLARRKSSAAPRESSANHQNNLLRAVAEGVTVEYCADDGSVFAARSQAVLRAIASVLDRIDGDAESHLMRFRVQQKTVRIGSNEIPEPMRSAPALNTPYFTAFSAFLMSEAEAELQWQGDFVDLQVLQAGLCHSTFAAAKQHALALVALAQFNPPQSTQE